MGVSSLPAPEGSTVSFYRACALREPHVPSCCSSPMQAPYHRPMGLPVMPQVGMAGPEQGVFAERGGERGLVRRHGDAGCSGREAVGGVGQARQQRSSAARSPCHRAVERARARPHARCAVTTPRSSPRNRRSPRVAHRHHICASAAPSRDCRALATAGGIRCVTRMWGGGDAAGTLKQVTGCECCDCS
jgi:hypothetical protein